MTTDNEAVAILRRTVNDIFWNDWDPIGVNEFPQARDEYDAYVIPMCRFLATHPDESAIFRQLVHYAENSMGLEAIDINATTKAARKLHLLTQ